MASTVLCLMTLTLGMDAGWRQLPDGGMEYIIQIEPDLLDTLRSGSEIISDIPPNLKDLRSYRIRVGTGKLPRDVPIEPPAEQSPLPEAQPADATAKSSPFGQDAPLFPWTHVPHTLPPSTDVQPLAEFPERPTSFAASPETEPDSAAGEKNAEEPAEAAAPKDPETSGGTLSLTLAAVSASCVGGMLFVGWVAWDYRRQYHLLLRRVLDGHVEGMAMDGDRIFEAQRQAASASPTS